MTTGQSPTLVEHLNRIGITPITIVLIYLFFGVGWALYSDLVIETLFKDPIWFSRVQLIKDWAFLGITAVFLLILLQQGVIALQKVRSQSDEIADRQLVAESLRDIMQVLNSSSDITQILQTIVLKAQVVLKADAISIYRLHSSDGELSIEASKGLPDEYTEIAKITLGQVATGKAALEKQPVTIEDIQEIDHQTLAVNDHSQTLLESLSKYYRAVLAVPLIGQDNLVQGTITLYYVTPQRFLPYDIELAKTYGNQAMLALANAALRQQIKEVVLNEERGRIARELHDSVTQTLYSIMLYSDASRMAQEQSKPDLLNTHLSSLRNLAREALTDMRLLIFELNPPVIEEEGFVNALRSRINSVEARSGFKVEMNILSECDLPLSVETEIYRIAHEALNNVAKHANADSVEITLKQTDESFYITIQDNGIGFELNKLENGGWGIRNIHERVTRLGGTFRLSSKLDAGTKMEISIPLPGIPQTGESEWSIT